MSFVCVTSLMNNPTNLGVMMVVSEGIVVTDRTYSAVRHPVVTGWGSKKESSTVLWNEIETNFILFTGYNDYCYNQEKKPKFMISSVNFINVLRVSFFARIFCQSQNVTRKSSQKRLSYEKNVDEIWNWHQIIFLLGFLLLWRTKMACPSHILYNHTYVFS